MKNEEIVENGKAEELVKIFNLLDDKKKDNFLNTIVADLVKSI